MRNEKKLSYGVSLVLLGAAMIVIPWVIQIILRIMSDSVQPLSDIQGGTMAVGLILIGIGGFIIEFSK